MTAPPQGPVGPVGKPGVSAGRAFNYMLTAFLVGWDKRMESVRLAKIGLQRKPGK